MLNCPQCNLSETRQMMGLSKLVLHREPALGPSAVQVLENLCSRLVFCSVFETERSTMWSDESGAVLSTDRSTEKSTDQSTDRSNVRVTERSTVAAPGWPTDQSTDYDTLWGGASWTLMKISAGSEQCSEVRQKHMFVLGVLVDVPNRTL